MGRSYKREILRSLRKASATGVELMEQLGIEPERVTCTLRRIEGEGLIEWDERLDHRRGAWRITEKGVKSCR